MSITRPICRPVCFDVARDVDEPAVNAAGPREIGLSDWEYLPRNLNWARASHTARATSTVRSSSLTNGNEHATSPTNQVVHPSIVAFDQPWKGLPGRYVMMITPYATHPDAELFENPSILVTDDINDQNSWVAPPGVLNPIRRRPAETSITGDPYLVYDSRKDRLVCVFIDTVGATGERRIWLIESYDGVTWSSGANILSSNSVEFSSPCLVTWVRDGEQVWRLIYADVPTDSPGTLHWREITNADILDPANWQATSEQDVTLNIPSGWEIWDFQIYRLKSGQWFGSHTLTDTGIRGNYNQHFGWSDDDLESLTCINPPHLVKNTGSWPDALTYTTCVIADGRTQKMVHTGKGLDGVWGRSQMDFELPQERALSLFPGDEQAGVIKSHGQRGFDFVASGSGGNATSSTFTTIPANRLYTGQCEGLASSPYSVLIRFRVPQNPTGLVDGTYVEICNVGGIRLQFTKHPGSPSQWLLDFVRNDNGVRIAGPVFLTHNTWFNVSFMRSGSTFRCNLSPSALGSPPVVTTLSMTQTAEYTLGRAVNPYPFDIQSIQVYFYGRTQTEINIAATNGPVTSLTGRKPHIESHPTNAAAGAGTSFNCVAYAFPGPSLEWRTRANSGASWETVPGATSNTYPRNTTGEAGRQFQCVASNVHGTVYSKIATVT